MSRVLKEWIGENDDVAIPPRVRFRVLLSFGRICAGSCGGRVIRPGDQWTCDHKVALINGGENREKNLQPLCAWCNPEKNKADVGEKSKTYDMGARHAGIRKRQARPMIGTRASGWKQKMTGEWVRR